MLKIFRRDPFSLQKELTTPKRDLFTDAFDRRREKQFLLDENDRNSFFSPAQKIAITWDIISGVALTIPVERRSRKSHSKSAVNKVHNVVVDGDRGRDSTSSASQVSTLHLQYL